MIEAAYMPSSILYLLLEFLCLTIHTTLLWRWKQENKSAVRYNYFLP